VPALSDPATVAIFLHTGDYDRVHQGLSIASAAAALGRRADLYLFWWALGRLLSGQLDEPDFPGQAEVARRFESRGLPTIRELLGHVRGSGRVTLVACSGSLAALGRTPADAEGKVDLILGWTSILERSAGLTDRFYL